MGTTSSDRDRRWVAGVEKRDPATRTYVGWIQADGERSMYVRAHGGLWIRASDGASADAEMNDVLEFLLYRAIGRRVSSLRGRWSPHGPLESDAS